MVQRGSAAMMSISGAPFVAIMQKGITTMSQYLLLLYHDPAGMRDLKPDEMERMVEKYMAWGKKPFVTGSQRLGHDAGKVLRAGPPPHVSDGPFIETKEVLGGYYAIEAANYEEAVARTKDHPHLAHGTIVIREFYRQ
jgi:hypothetical protein